MNAEFIQVLVYIINIDHIGQYGQVLSEIWFVDDRNHTRKPFYFSFEVVKIVKISSRLWVLIKICNKIFTVSSWISPNNSVKMPQPMPRLLWELNFKLKSLQKHSLSFFCPKHKFRVLDKKYLTDKRSKYLPQCKKRQQPVIPSF